MSQFYDQASLVMVPSGYKAGKVYSQKPLTTDGQLTFTRTGDTATRVNADGLVEKVRTNLLLQSNTFSNATWVKFAAGTGSAAVVTSGQADPDGGTNAWRLQCDLNGGTTSSDRSYITQSGISATPFLAAKSVWVKNNTASPVNIFIGINNIFDAVTIAASADWQRVKIEGGTINSEFRIGTMGGAALSDVVDVIIYQAQLETGDIATDYIPTTTAAVSVGPVANLPRIDYTGVATGGNASGCGKLLLEPQRTNLMPYSEQFNDSSWTKLNATITANQAVSPDGYSNADQITDDATNGAHLAYRILSSRSTGTAWSVFMKKGTLDFGFIGNIQSSTAYTTAVIDLTNGTVKELQNGSGNTGSVTVQDYGSGWYRVILQSSANGGGTSIGTSDGSALSGATKDAIYSGTGKYIYIWGAQLEDATYTSSYVGPTLSAAVTRGEDSALKTGISSLIGQTEGVLFIDMEFNDYDNLSKWVAFLGSGSNYIGIYTTTTSRFYVEVNNAASQQFSNSSYVFTVGQRYKLAVAYKENDFAFYINGTQVATDNSGTVPAMSQFSLQYNTTANNLTARTYNQILLFTSRLTNAQLAELTTL